MTRTRPMAPAGQLIAGFGPQKAGVKTWLRRAVESAMQSAVVRILRPHRGSFQRKVESDDFGFCDACTTQRALPRPQRLLDRR